MEAKRSLRYTDFRSKTLEVKKMNEWINAIMTGIKMYTEYAFLPIAVIFLGVSIRRNSFRPIAFLYSEAFALYISCVIALVFFPLPDAATVMTLNGYHGRFVPFSFISDIARERSLESVLQVLFNIVMMVPFGVFLTFRKSSNLKKTVIYTFLFSLFIEIGQLTGLFFTYAGSYRLFDPDDLITNTLGGLIGALVTALVLARRPKLNVLANSREYPVFGFVGKRARQ